MFSQNAFQCTGRSRGFVEQPRRKADQGPAYCAIPPFTIHHSPFTIHRDVRFREVRVLDPDSVGEPDAST